MKTLELRLKKDVLIVDAEGLEITQALIFNKFGNYNLSYYDYICKGSELTEEIASEFVENKTKHKFENKVLTFYNSENLESFISAVGSKGFYWLVNPCGKNRPIKNDYNSLIQFNGYLEEWQEAEEKTFRNPLIFVKK